MTLPVIERILQVCEARLTAITAIADLTVERNRAEDVETWPSLILHDGDEGPADVGMVAQHFRTITVEGFVRVADRAQLGPALTTLHAEAVKALTADVSLGGLAVNVDIGEYLGRPALQGDTEWQGSFSQDLEILYWTKVNDPYALAP